MGEGVYDWVLRRVENQTPDELMLLIIQLLDMRSCHVRYHTNG